MTNKDSEAIKKLSHHIQQEYCYTRSPYRMGKQLTAVKVYTVNDESQHLIIHGVPQLQLCDEIKRIFASYGGFKLCKVITNYPSEEFTESFHVQFKRIHSARMAKRSLDNKNFYGGVLHVCYAPELEDIIETQKKLILRQNEVLLRIKKHIQDPTCTETKQFLPREQYHRQKKHPTLPVTAQRLSQQYHDGRSLTLNNKGTTIFSDTRLVLGTEFFYNEKIQRDEKINCKGYIVRDHGKMVRPKLIDTRTLSHYKPREEPKNILQVVKKGNNDIKIRVPAHLGNKGKRIVIKNSSTTKLINSRENLQTSIQSIKSSIRKAMQKA